MSPPPTPYRDADPTFDRWIPKRGRVLETRCGAGRWLRALALRRAGDELTLLGADPYPANLERARRACAEDGAGVTFLMAPLGDLPFAAASFHLVVSRGELERAERPEALLAELARLVGADGALGVSWLDPLDESVLSAAKVRDVQLDALVGWARELGLEVLEHGSGSCGSMWAIARASVRPTLV